MSLMKAMQVHALGADFELVRKQIPEPRANEVLLKVEASGMCHSDAIVKEGGDWWLSMALADWAIRRCSTPSSSVSRR